MDFIANTDVVSKIRWVVLIIGGILLFILITWGIASLARTVFGSDNTGDDTTTSENRGVADSDSEEGLLNVRTVRYTVEGPIVATQDHRSYTIEVSSGTVLMRVYSNYGQIVIDEKTYSNNDEAYTNFIESLEALNVTSRLLGTSVDDDFAEKGVCPDGRRHVLELGDDVRRWFTSCYEFPGTAGTNMNAVRRLFIRQVPEFNELISDTGLRLSRD